MDWKEFLLLDKRKMVLFIIFFICLGLSAYLWIGGPGYSPSFFEKIFMSVFLAPAILIGQLGSGISVFLIILIFPIIYWYFISCFIVWVYDKLKKK